MKEKLYKQYHRNYANIKELYEDLNDCFFGVVLEDQTIVFKTTDLRIESTDGGYITYWNGEREYGVVEDQDIFEYVAELVPVLPIEEDALWQFSPNKIRQLYFTFKYQSIVFFGWFLLGLCCVLFLDWLWKGVLILFGGIAAFVFVIMVIAVLRQDKMHYKITKSKIIVEYPAIGYVTHYANIKDIKLSRSIFNKKVGTIRFKLKKGLSMNYQFAGIDDVDMVYDLLLSLWKEQQPNQ